jgi:hypothetical protein
MFFGSLLLKYGSRDTIRPVSRDHLKAKHLGRFLIELIRPAVNYFKIPRILLVTNHLSDINAQRFFDKIRPVFLRTSLFINGF